MIHHFNRLQGFYSLSGRTSHQQNSWRLEATRLGVLMIASLWNLAGISAALLLRSNCQISERLEMPRPKSRGFETRSCGKASARLVNRGPHGRLISVRCWICLFTVRTDANQYSGTDKINWMKQSTSKPCVYGRIYTVYDLYDVNEPICLTTATNFQQNLVHILWGLLYATTMYLYV